MTWDPELEDAKRQATWSTLCLMQALAKLARTDPELARRAREELDAINLRNAQLEAFDRKATPRFQGMTELA